LHEAAGDQLGHVLCEGGGQRRQPEDQEVDLVGEAPAVFVADKTGDQRSDRHADKGQRDELQVLRQCRELGLDGGSEHAAGDIEVVAVEEHPGADETEDPVVKRRDRQAVEPRAGVDCCCHVDVPPLCRMRRRLRRSPPLCCQFSRRCPAVSRYQSNGASPVATITLLTLKWSSKLSVPHSRPTPESPTPPQGEAGSSRWWSLIQTMPALTPAATRWARATSRVRIAAASPNGESLASRSASA